MINSHKSDVTMTCHKRQQEALTERITSSVERLTAILESIHEEVNNLQHSATVVKLTQVADMWQRSRENFAITPAGTQHSDDQAVELAKADRTRQRQVGRVTVVPRKLCDSLTTRTRITTRNAEKAIRDASGMNVNTASRVCGREPVPTSRYMHDTHASRMRSQSRKRARTTK